MHGVCHSVARSKEHYNYSVLFTDCAMKALRAGSCGYYSGYWNRLVTVATALVRQHAYFSHATHSGGRSKCGFQLSSSAQVVS